MKRVSIIGSIIVLVSFFVPFRVWAAAELGITKPPVSVESGQSFTVSVFVKSAQEPINALSGTLSVPDTLEVSGISRRDSIVNFWTSEPHTSGATVVFEGVVLNPGYQGSQGKLFDITFIAKKSGKAAIRFATGAVLANDGLGTNIIDSLGSVAVVVKSPSTTIADNSSVPEHSVPDLSIGARLVALPVIVEYPDIVGPGARFTLKGKGEPNALTRIVFKQVATKSLGEQFIDSVQEKKEMPTEALVKNNAEGIFQYISSDNLLAGAYNATPYLVDSETQTQKPGFGVQVLIENSDIVKMLTTLINVLVLLIPIVALCVIIYFIPWYSRLRMRVLQHRITLEDERLTLSKKQLEQRSREIDSWRVPPRDRVV